MIQPSKEITYLSPLDEVVTDLSRALLQALAQRGIASRDLTSVFRQEASKGEPLFFAANRHPNAQGQAFVWRQSMSALGVALAVCQMRGVRIWPGVCLGPFLVRLSRRLGTAAEIPPPKGQ